MTNGNVGIGIPNPDERLVVYGGNLKIYSGSPEGARLIWRGGANGTQEYRTRVGMDGTFDFFTEEGHASTLSLTQSRNVGIGTSDTKGYKLAVAGNMIAEKVTVKLSSSWPDYVFHPGYCLPQLKDVEAFIKKNNHLPDVPSAKEVTEKGIDIGDNQAVLLKKIEELTLYIIGQDKKIEQLASENARIKDQVNQLEKRR